MTTKLIEEGELYYPALKGKTLIPRYWHLDQDATIFVDCVEDPSLSRYVFYLTLKDWTIDEKQ